MVLLGKKIIAGNVAAMCSSGFETQNLNKQRMMIVEQMLKNAPKPLLHIADVSGSALFNGDCLDIMPLIPDKSVQLILADLPYGTTACKWDSVLPFDKLWKEYERIITDNGAIVLTAQQPFTSALIMSNTKLYKYDWYWKKSKPVGFANAKKMPLKDVETISVFYKSLPKYNPQGLEKCNRIISNSTKKIKQNNITAINGGAFKTDTFVQEFTNYPRQIIEIGVEQGLHPTQKPKELMKYLISTYTDENDMVLDNTMGSGTTCLAAKELNRKFIGIEKEPKYYEIACQRCGF